VIQALETKYMGLNLATGVPLWTLSGGNAFSGTNVRAPATVATIDVAGTPTPVMFSVAVTLARQRLGYDHRFAGHAVGSSPWQHLQRPRLPRCDPLYLIHGAQ